MNRREFLQATTVSAALLGAGGCARRLNLASERVVGAPALPFYDAVPQLVPIRANTDRLFKITVCLRPFRAQGPRLDVEKVGDKIVVHNYGHGGSGWSLSWGSSTLAVGKALTDGDRDVAVIGCGALGLTSALLAQRAGAKVTIYAKERPPEVRSSRATGSWTPDSRIALVEGVGAEFAGRWETMARTSFAIYQSYLGLAGDPVEWVDRYSLSDDAPDGGPKAPQLADSKEFVHLNDRISDLTPRWEDLPPGSHSFPTRYARRSATMTFNIADYSRQLYGDFLLSGGKIETAEFHEPGELGRLPQRVVINATGYGARALWKDESIVPVRGQIGWLIPQPGVNYGLYFDGLNVLGRRDGIVVQLNEKGDMTGWNDTNEAPDRAEAERGVRMLAGLCGRMQQMGKVKA